MVYQLVTSAPFLRPDDDDFCPGSVRRNRNCAPVFRNKDSKRGPRAETPSRRARESGWMNEGYARGSFGIIGCPVFEATRAERGQISASDHGRTKVDFILAPRYNLFSAAKKFVNRCVHPAIGCGVQFR